MRQKSHWGQVLASEVYTGLILGPNLAPAQNILLKRDLAGMPNLSSEWDMCIACLSAVMLQNVMFIKKKNYHEAIKDGDMFLQNELPRIAL